MNKATSIIVITVIVLLALAGGLYAAMKHRAPADTIMSGTSGTAGNTSTSNNKSGSPSTGNSSAGSETAQAADKVTIQNLAFTPASIMVKTGTTVTWTNNDSMAHTVTESDGQTGPASGDVNPGSTYTFAFTKAGTYHYHCTVHPSMTGTVVVTS